MRYATYRLVIFSGQIEVSDPFSLPLALVRSGFMGGETRRHTSRLEALHRVQVHNSNQIVRNGRPQFWMVAVELDWNGELDADSLSLEGEQGIAKACTEVNFRVMSPSIEEAEILTGAIPQGSPAKSAGVAMHVARIDNGLPAGGDQMRHDLRESVTCYRRRLWRPAAVLLGCLSEKIVQEVMAAYLPTIEAARVAKYERRVKRAATDARRFEVFCKHYQPERYGAEVDEHDRLQDAYRVIRQTRNRACHPHHPDTEPVGRGDVAECYARMIEFSQLAFQMVERFQQMEASRAG